MVDLEHKKGELKRSPFYISDLVKTIYSVTAIPIVFRTLLKNWTSGRSGLLGSGFKGSNP